MCWNFCSQKIKCAWMRGKYFEKIISKTNCFDFLLLVVLPPSPNAPSKLRVMIFAAVLPICLVTELSNTFSTGRFFLFAGSLFLFFLGFCSFLRSFFQFGVQNFISTFAVCHLRIFFCQFGLRYQCIDLTVRLKYPSANVAGPAWYAPMAWECLFHSAVVINASPMPSCVAVLLFYKILFQDNSRAACLIVFRSAAVNARKACCTFRPSWLNTLAGISMRVLRTEKYAYAF